MFARVCLCVCVLVLFEQQYFYSRHFRSSPASSITVSGLQQLNITFSTRSASVICFYFDSIKLNVDVSVAPMRSLRITLSRCVLYQRAIRKCVHGVRCDFWLFSRLCCTCVCSDLLLNVGHHFGWTTPNVCAYNAKPSHFVFFGVVRKLLAIVLCAL